MRPDKQAPNVAGDVDKLLDYVTAAVAAQSCHRQWGQWISLLNVDFISSKDSGKSTLIR